MRSWTANFEQLQFGRHDCGVCPVAAGPRILNSYNGLRASRVMSALRLDREF